MPAYPTCCPLVRFPHICQTSKTRMCARLEIRTGRRSASEMQSCWLDNPTSPRAQWAHAFSIRRRAEFRRNSRRASPVNPHIASKMLRATGHARMVSARARRARRALVRVIGNGRIALTRALRARRARPPEVAEKVAEKVAYLAASQPRAQRA